MTPVRIGQHTVGSGSPCYIIAEAGSNHDGKREQAFRLIEAAAEAGADAVKFQVFRADTLYPRAAGKPGYLSDRQDIHDLIANMELPPEWLPELAARCRAASLDFLATPFDERAVEFLDPLVPAFKIASYELTHHPLVHQIASRGKPVILSTGASRMDEVAEAVEVVRAAGNPNLVLLQCTAKYPAPLGTLHLRAMQTFGQRFALPFGLSDHSREVVPGPLAAVALGASVLEKHFTLSRRLPGPDHPFALEPDELRSMVRGIRGVEQSLGSAVKEPDPVEEELRRFARRSIFAVRPIAAGEPFSPQNTAVLRCGSLGQGLPPARYPDILGRTAARAIEVDRPIVEQDLLPGLDAAR